MVLIFKGLARTVSRHGPILYVFVLVAYLGRASVAQMRCALCADLIRCVPGYMWGGGRYRTIRNISCQNLMLFDKALVVSNDLF
jgi:hypothetical protein